MQTQTVTSSQLRITLAFGVFLVLVGAAMLLFGVTFVRDATASRSWPTAEGRVQNTRTEVDISTSNTTSSSSVLGYYFVVSYAYTVDDVRYSGNRFSLGEGPRASKIFDERSAAGQAAERDYPVGSVVVVHYDPDDPSSAVLSSGANWGTYVPLVLGALFLLGGLWLVRAMRNTLQRQARLEADPNYVARNDDG